jgi:hypothetical protein
MAASSGSRHPSAILFGCQADIRLQDGVLPGIGCVRVVAAWDSRGNLAELGTTDESVKGIES